MAANENVLTQPKFELGITGIIQMCFRAIRPQNKKNEKLLEKLFSTEGGGGTPPWKFHENIFFVFGNLPLLKS